MFVMQETNSIMQSSKDEFQNVLVGNAILVLLIED